MFEIGSHAEEILCSRSLDWIFLADIPLDWTSLGSISIVQASVVLEGRR